LCRPVLESANGEDFKSAWASNIFAAKASGADLSNVEADYHAKWEPSADNPKFFAGIYFETNHGPVVAAVYTPAESDNTCNAVASPSCTAYSLRNINAVA
jgi:hypothetical protein